MTGAASGLTFGRRLVFFGAAEDVNEPTLLQLFSRHGDVTGLFLVRSALGLPSGCGYVTMATAEQAAAALTALQGSSECAEEGGKLGLLIVQLPQQALESQQPQSLQQQQDKAASNAPVKDVRTAFFTKVPPTVTAHQLIQLFTSCGDVVHVELFTPWPGAKISKGCGLVEFSEPEAAVAAVHSLHQAFTWPHSHSPLVVEWLDAKRQAANRASKLSKQGSGDSSSHMRRTAAAAAAAEPAVAAYGSHSAHLGSVQVHLVAQQQQYSARSCPLPRLQAQQLPAGWMQPGWPAAGAGGAQPGMAYVRPNMVPQLQQLQPQMAASYPYQQQQQHGDLSANGGCWWPLPNVAGAPSCYDNSGMLGIGSAMSTISTSSSSLVAPINSADLSTGSLTCCSVGSPAVCVPGTDMLMQQQFCQPRTLHAYSGSGCQSPVGAGDPSLGMAGAAGSVMLLQPMADDGQDQGQAMYVLGGGSGMMQMAGAAAPGAYSSMPASAGSLTLQQQQYQQLAGAQASSALYAAAAGAATGQPAKQQQWWAAPQPCSQPLQQQAAVCADEVMMALQLTARQLAVIAGVLAEVPRLTGAKAYVGANTSGRGVQMVLAGQANTVSAAHSVVAALLSNMGIDDPLLPAGAQG